MVRNRNEVQESKLNKNSNLKETKINKHTGKTR
jgi:hypothetical protein